MFPHHVLRLRWRNENRVLNRWGLTLIRQVMMLMTFALLRQHVWLLTVQVLSFFPLPDSRRLAASEGLFNGAAQWMRLFFQSHPSIFELRCMYRFVGLYTRASVSILLTCQCLSLYRYLYLYISCSLYDQSTRKQSQTNKQEVRELVTRFDSVWWVLWQISHEAFTHWINETPLSSSTVPRF